MLSEIPKPLFRDPIQDGAADPMVIWNRAAGEWCTRPGDRLGPQHLFPEFPDDPHTWDVTDQFVLGDDLLVAPVVESKARSRSVYFPVVARWTDLASGDIYDGGQVVLLPAPIGTIPVFARDGALQELVGSTVVADREQQL
ncbi:hypothetical protein [Arthrobacter sp. R4-81]